MYQKGLIPMPLHEVDWRDALCSPSCAQHQEKVLTPRLNPLILLSAECKGLSFRYNPNIGTNINLQTDYDVDKRLPLLFKGNVSLLQCAFCDISQRKMDTHE